MMPVTKRQVQWEIQHCSEDYSKAYVSRGDVFLVPVARVTREIDQPLPVNSAARCIINVRPI